MYKTPVKSYGQLEPTGIIRVLDGAYIPFDPANTDYQAFLRWCDEGNVPEPADEVTE